MAQVVNECTKPCTKIIKFMTDRKIPANTGISLPPYENVDGYRYINIFVKFSQLQANELPVDLGVIFAFDANGDMGARKYANLEANVPGQQPTNFIDVSGSGSWHGNPHNISSYMARFPIMGPFVEVFPFNRGATARTVTIWGYLVS
jgi:hypothetical protein